MSRDQLIIGVLQEIERIFGASEFEGTGEQYDWLLEHYRVTEEEDVKWQFLLYDDPFDAQEVFDALDRENPDHQEMIEFVDSDEQVLQFLRNLYVKYRESRGGKWAGKGGADAT